VAGLLAIWRLHGWDEIFREVWEAGVVLGGVSAGSLCWHVGGTTDSFGPELRPVTNGLALLPYSNGVHYDSEDQRRPLYQQLIADEVLPAGFATDDGVGLHYRGTELVEAVADRPGAKAYRVERGHTGKAIEQVIEPRLLAGGDGLGRVAPWRWMPAASSGVVRQAAGPPIPGVSAGRANTAVAVRASSVAARQWGDLPRPDLGRDLLGLGLVPGATAGPPHGRPTSYTSAGTSSERTTIVSSSTPNATAKPISARNTSGSTPSTENVAASTTRPR
jgi:hypothetical protein